MRMNKMKKMNVKMKNKETRRKLPSKLLSFALAVAMLLPLISSLPMPVFAAEGDGITYVGTHGSGDTLSFAHGAGYNVYKSYTDGTTPVEFANGICTSGKALSFYLIPDEKYNIIECKMWDEDTGSTVEGDEEALQGTDGGLQVTIKAEDMLEGRHIKISVSVAVTAKGGVVSAGSSAYDVATMFDASYTTKKESLPANITTIVTNNVTVVKDGSTFTVTLGDNLLLKGTDKTAGFTVKNGATLTVLSSGDYMIKRGNRGSYVGNMFYVENGATLNLGSGILANNTVTYFYSDGISITKEIEGTVDEPSSEEKTAAGAAKDAYLISAVSNAVVTSTMLGTLTIDGGAIFDEYTSGRPGGSYAPRDEDRAGTPFENDEDYSYQRRPTNSEYNYKKNHWALIKTKGGTINMWPGVTLQNNYSYGSDVHEYGERVYWSPAEGTKDADETGGAGIKMMDGGTFYMYGGIIQNCIAENGYMSLNWNGSDGGAIAEQGGECKIFLYGGEIRYCEATHGSAITMRSNTGNSGLWIFDTNIHHNYSTGIFNENTPPKTITIWDNQNSHIKMFGGSIHNNDNPIEKKQWDDIERSADISISADKNTTVKANIYLYGGTVNAISCSATIETKANLYIYAASVDEIMWGSTNSEEHYPAGHLLHAVTIPYSTEYNATVTVTVECINENGVTYSRLTTAGTAKDRGLTLRLPDGNYTITVNSPSMVKEYSVEVKGTDATAKTVSRTVTQPILVSKNSESVTLSMIGTDNVDADGIMYYGCSYDDEPRHALAWYYIDLGDNDVLDQADKIYVMKQNGVEEGTGKFTYADAVPYTESAFVFDAEARTVTIKYEFGPRYYFGTSGHVVDNTLATGYLKGEASDGHFENLVRVNTVEITPSKYTSTHGSIATYSAVVTYNDGSTDNRVTWSFVGGTSATTNITQHGVLHIAYDEQAEPVLQTYSTIADEGLEPHELTFTNSEYEVPAEGLPYGYYYIMVDDNPYYFLTTSKLLAGDKLTWNASEETVTQSVNRIFVTAYATVDGTKTAEAMWEQSRNINMDSHMSEIDVYRGGVLAGRVTEFEVCNGEEHNISYQRTATVKIDGALPGSDIFPYVVPTGTDAEAKISAVYNGDNRVTFDKDEGYKLGADFEVSTFVYIEVKPPQGDSITYRLEIQYTQAENSWIVEPYCDPVNVNETLSPMAEALYGEVIFEWAELQSNGETWRTISGTPSAVGTYRLIASVAGTTFYKGLEPMSVRTEIYAAGVEWKFEGLEITSITYGQTLDNSKIVGTAKFKDESNAFNEVSGTFYWVDPKAVPEVNSGVLYAIGFEPDKNSGYGKIVAGQMPVTVEMATPDIDEQPTVVYDGRTPSQNGTLISLAITPGVATNNYITVGDRTVAGTWIWTDYHLTINEQLGKEVSIHFVPNDLENYRAVTTTITLKISITVTADSQEIFYGDHIDQSRFTISDYSVRNDGADPIASVKLVATLEDEAVEHNGTITPNVTLRAGEEAYYNIIEVEGKLTYKLLTPTLTISAGTVVTSAQGMMMQFTYTYNGYDGADGIDNVRVTSSDDKFALISNTQDGDKKESYSVDGLVHEKEYPIFVQAASEDYGYSIITISVPAKGHYAAIEGSFTFNVSPDGTIIIVDQVNTTYDGKEHKPEGTAYKKDGTTYVVTPEFYTDEAKTAKMDDFTNATTGPVTLYYSVQDGSNKYVGSTTLTIAPKELTVTWSDLSKVYNGEEQSPSCEVSDTGVDGETATVSLSFDGGVQPINAGTYTATANLTIIGGKAKPENYTLLDAERSFTITAAEVSIDTDKPPYEDSVYDAVEVESPKWQAMFGGTVVSELLGYTFYKQVTQSGETQWIETTAGDETGAMGLGTAPINAGEYGVSATYSAKNGGNFAEAVTEIQSFSITKCPITITTEDQVSYNADLTANPDTTKVHVEGGGIPGHEVKITEVSGTCTLEQGKAEKTFKASIKDSQGNDVSSNYTITTEAGFLYVFPAFVVSGEKYNELTESETRTPKDDVPWGGEDDPVIYLSFDELRRNGREGDTGVFVPGHSGEWDQIANVDEEITFLDYWGWVGVKDDTIGEFGYQIDDQTPIYNVDFTHTTGEDVKNYASSNNFGLPSRMLIRIDISSLSGSHTVRTLYKNPDGEVVLLSKFTLKRGDYDDVFNNETDAVATPSKNDAFSFYFGTLYKSDGQALSIDFGGVLPAGSTVTMVEYNTEGVPFYYYYMCGDSPPERIELKNFTKMGSDDIKYVDSNAVDTLAVKYLQFIVRHPNGEEYTHYEPELYQGTELVSQDSEGRNLPISVTLSDETVGGTLMLGAEVLESNAGSLGMTITVDGLVSDGLVSDGGIIAVELLSKDNEKCVYPAGARILLGGYTPVKILDNVAYFDAVQNGTYTFELDMKEAHMLTECKYKLKVQLWTSASDETPKKTFEPNGTVKVGQYIRNAISVQSDNRTATDFITFTVQYIGTVPSGTELTCKEIQHRAETDSEFSDVESPAWSMNMKPSSPDEGDVKAYEVTISNLREVDKGIYVLTFVYGNATYLYSFVVTS